LPARQLAIDNFTKAIFSNTIALGAMARLLVGDIEKEVILKSILEIIPKFHEENRAAFELGYKFIREGLA
jgi:2-oxoglutarate ferredoxin oxidoreductase subunit gamma